MTGVQAKRTFQVRIEEWQTELYNTNDKSMQTINNNNMDENKTGKIPIPISTEPNRRWIVEKYTLFFHCFVDHWWWIPIHLWKIIPISFGGFHSTHSIGIWDFFPWTTQSIFLFSPAQLLHYFSSYIRISDSSCSYMKGKNTQTHSMRRVERFLCVHYVFTIVFKRCSLWCFRLDWIGLVPFGHSGFNKCESFFYVYCIHVFRLVHTYWKLKISVNSNKTTIEWW